LPQLGFLALGTSTALDIIALFIAVLAAIGIYFVVWALRRKPVTGVESMKGQSGVVVSDVTEKGGEVSLYGVIWRAKIYDESGTPISKGEQVVVVGVSSLTLLVRRKDKKSD
jgi:membrane-bound ClpP family serine protease